jgi:hypothetical protein
MSKSARDGGWGWSFGGFARGGGGRGAAGRGEIVGSPASSRTAGRSVNSSNSPRPGAVAVPREVGACFWISGRRGEPNAGSTDLAAGRFANGSSFGKSPASWTAPGSGGTLPVPTPIIVVLGAGRGGLAGTAGLGGAPAIAFGWATTNECPHFGHRIFRPVGGTRRSSTW